MIIPGKKILFTAFILIGSLLILLSIVVGFKGFSSSIEEESNPNDTVYSIQTFKLPDNVTFAGENMPLENFDTKESLEREILTSAYRHS
jgi:membrane-bound lytic murein transglycosylase D